MSRERGPRPDIEHTQSLEEKVIAFSETKEFSDYIQAIQLYLESIREKFKKHEHFFVREPNFNTISYCFGKIILETPVLAKRVLKNQDGAIPKFADVRYVVRRRICAMLTYEDKADPGIPLWTYNLNLEWKWEDRLKEIIAM